MISSFSEVTKKGMVDESDIRHMSSGEEFKNSMETLVPNGIHLLQIVLLLADLKALDLTNILFCRCNSGNSRCPSAHVFYR